MLVEKVCVCSLQTNVGVAHLLPPPVRRDWRGGLGPFLYVEHDKTVITALTGEPIVCATKYLLVVHLQIGEEAISQDEFQQVYHYVECLDIINYSYRQSG